MVEVELSKIIIDEKRQEQMIVLKEKSGSRALPIIIGTNEALAIRMHLGGFTPPRPLTHDLLKAVIKDLEAEVEKIIINKILNGTFYALLILRSKDGRIIEVDARPSDSIALAVRTRSPIYVEEEVLNHAAVSY